MGRFDYVTDRCQVCGGKVEGLWYERVEFPEFETFDISQVTEDDVDCIEYIKCTSCKQQYEFHLPRPGEQFVPKLVLGPLLCYDQPARRPLTEEERAEYDMKLGDLTKLMFGDVIIPTNTDFHKAVDRVIKEYDKTSSRRGIKWSHK